MDDPIVTSRLLLPPLVADAIQALIDADGERLEALTGAQFPRPVAVPPLMDDALPFFRDRLRDDPAIAPWWVRLMVKRDIGQAVGSAGFAGLPDGTGTVTLGDAVYPAFQGSGFATEAVLALVAWAFRQPRVAGQRAVAPRRRQGQLPPDAHNGRRRGGRGRGLGAKG